MFSPASEMQPPAANPGGTAGDEKAEYDSVPQEGSLLAQGIHPPEPKHQDVSGMPKDSSNEGEGDKLEKDGSKAAPTAGGSSEDKDHHVLAARQDSTEQSARGPDKASGLISGEVEGGDVLGGALALDVPSEGKSSAAHGPSLPQHKEAEALPTSPVKERTGETSPGQASTTPLPYRLGGSRSGHDEAYLRTHPRQQRQQRDDERGQHKSSSDFTTSGPQPHVTSQQGLSGGAARQPRDARSWRKQDSTSMEDKAMDVLPDFFYCSFEEELRKEGLRLRKQPAAAVPYVSQTTLQPLGGEGGEEQAPAAEEQQEAASPQRQRYAMVTWSDTAQVTSGVGMVGSRPAARKPRLGQSDNMNLGNFPSDNTNTSFLGSMSETDFGLSTSNLDPDDPLRLKHSRLTPQLFSIHSEPAQGVQAGMQNTEDNEDSLDQSGHKVYVSGGGAASFRPMRIPQPQGPPQHPPPLAHSAQQPLPAEAQRPVVAGTSPTGAEGLSVEVPVHLSTAPNPLSTGPFEQSGRPPVSPQGHVQLPLQPQVQGQAQPQQQPPAPHRDPSVTTPGGSVRREVHPHLTTVTENDGDDGDEEEEGAASAASRPAQHATKDRNFEADKASSLLFSPRAEWPDQLPATVPTLDHLRHGDTTGGTGPGKSGTWPFDRSDVRDTTGENSEDAQTSGKQGGGKQDASTSSGVSPYRDNLDYLRDQFRLMRIIEERNRVNRQELVTHAFGSDPMEEDLFSEVDREYPIPREFEGSYTGTGGNYGTSSALNGTLTELLQLLGSDRVLLGTDDDEASRYLSRMWDDDLIATPDVNLGSDLTNSMSNNITTMRDGTPTPTPQRPSICSPLVLGKNKAGTGSSSASASQSNSTQGSSGTTSTRSLQDTRPTTTGPGTLDINNSTPRPIKGTTQMSSSTQTKDTASTRGAQSGKVTSSSSHLTSTYDTLTDTAPTSSVSLGAGSTVESNATGGVRSTISSKDTHKTAPSVGRQSSSATSVVTEDGTQWDQSSLHHSPVRHKKAGGGYGQRRVQSEEGEEAGDPPKEIKRQALTTNLRQKEKVLRAHIRQKLIATWTQCRWIPRLEVLSKAFDLSRFEKLVLVSFVAKHFAKVYLGLSYSVSGTFGLRELVQSQEEETTIQDMARSFLPRLRDQMVAPFKYFSPSSPLVRESIITVFQGSSMQGGNNRMWQQMTPHHHRLHPMLQRVAINLSIAEHLLDTASMHPGAKHLDRHLRAHEEEGVHEPNMPLRNVILPPKTRQKIETALKNLGLYLELRRRPALGMGPTSRRGCGTIFLFTGKPGSGKSLLGEAVATELGKKLVSSGRSCRPNFPDLFMQAKMNDAVIVANVQGPGLPGGYAGAGTGSLMHEGEGEETPLMGILRSALEGSQADWSSFEEEMERHNDLVILIAQSASLLPKPLRRWVSLLVELDEQPDHILRRQLWEVMRPEDFTLADDVELDALAVKWPFNAGLIKSSWIMAQLFAVLRDGESPRITQEDLHKAARNQLDEKLRMEAPDERSGPITSSTGPPGAGGIVTGLDLAVLNPAMRESLWMIVNNAKACEVVYGQWGFRPDHAAAAGVKALFWGPPGTGKTHAAHCISYELGKTLKVANAAQLTSKFVGDTSKNLQKLFRDAKESGSVLLFDEAEGLFSERRDSSEKHDLEEANLLLQLVESFDGVMIATTNRPDLVDVAFRRRFDIWVEFGEPSDRERAELWRMLFPAQAPLAKDLDFSLLGRRFPMSGGHIKSAVRRAAMRAALRTTADQMIKMEDLLWAATEEMKKKEGGPVSDAPPSHLYS